MDSKIKEDANFLFEQKYTYEDLCWMLAEIQLKYNKGYDNVSESAIKNKAEELKKSSLKNDDICWKIAELNHLASENE